MVRRRDPSHYVRGVCGCVGGAGGVFTAADFVSLGFEMLCKSVSQASLLGKDLVISYFVFIGTPQVVHTHSMLVLCNISAKLVFNDSDHKPIIYPCILQI